MAERVHLGPSTQALPKIPGVSLASARQRALNAHVSLPFQRSGENTATLIRSLSPSGHGLMTLAPKNHL